MKKKFMLLLAGSMVTGMMLTGCNNDDDQVPPPPVNDEVDTPLDNDNNLDGDDEGLENTRYRNGDGLFNNDRNYKDDTNRDTDKDPMRDRNTPREDIIEDDLDANDRDNRDR